MTADRPVPRTARAAVFAAVCVALAALGHAVMSGRPLPWWSLAAGWCATLGAAWALAGRRCGPAGIVGATLVTQYGLHSLFRQASGQGMSDRPRALDPVVILTRPHEASAVHELHGTSVHEMAAQSMAAHGMPMAHSGSGSGMVLAHLLAAVLCGLWLWRGETAAFRLCQALLAVVFAPVLLLLRRVEGAKPPQRRPVPRRPFRARGVLLAHAVSLRGPPASPVPS
ncbi:hypothetical protein [Wenjunlia tyrosinilytica]|uniref:Uncharacterized protein n=1 Tax=Wenjunlia tyrosinilytica TaxID=1544741 RepID=A0A917ZSE9_9ACTN|nr:hypothetical protein [Wenjunlia tyrosinilytica]GGO92496.1 hypothetical protein GCM10012280_42810 [Wenjunlia tyrosinilytica]